MSDGVFITVKGVNVFNSSAQDLFVSIPGDPDKPQIQTIPYNQSAFFEVEGAYVGYFKDVREPTYSGSSTYSFYIQQRETFQ